MTKENIISFTPTYQNYLWGKLSKDSLICKYIDQEEILEDIPYAELWLGAHPKASGLISHKLSLNKFINENAVHTLGDSLELFGAELPFLLKILSINRPLSIQAHPDKKLAKILHESRPDVYPDSNHKPEMAVALSTLDLLVGFKDPKEIKENAEEYPAIKIAADYVDPTKDLKLFFKNIMDYPKLGLESLFNSIKRKLLSKNPSELKIEEQYFLKTYKEDFPQGDHGLFAFFILQFVRLQKGEAIEIKENTPHCYLYGDLVECMANSDNVVRAGLTEKYCDADVLIKMLNYENKLQNLLTKIVKIDNLKITEFLTSYKDFKLLNITGSSMNYEFCTNNRPSIIFNLEGTLEYYIDDLNVETCPITNALFIPASTSSINLKLKDTNLFIASPNF